MVKRRRTGSFWAVDDDRKRHFVIIYTQYTDATSPGSNGHDVSGVLEYVTSNGLRVNRLEKGKYQMLQSGTILRSDSPDAP